MGQHKKREKILRKGRSPLPWRDRTREGMKFIMRQVSLLIRHLAKKRNGMIRSLTARLPAALCCWLPALLLLCIPATDSFAWETVEFRESPAVIEPEIDYISKMPEIDGILDENLRDLPERHFNSVLKDNAENPEVASSFRLAYGAQFLYVYLEAAGAEVEFHVEDDKSQESPGKGTVEAFHRWIEKVMKR